jgi:sensor histidine kinase YesM
VRIQQQYLIFGLIIMFLAALGGILYTFQQRRLANAKVENAINEQRLLRSQMNPHFVFNALNSIQDYIMNNERKMAGKYLGKFADLMRLNLHQSDSKQITISDEVKTLQLYLELEKLRFEDTLQYHIVTDPALDSEMVCIPSLLIQPYVENALKHGLLPLKSQRLLSIEFKHNATADFVICTIEDNGIGRKEAERINKLRDPNHKSFAISALKSRIDLINKENDRPITEEIIDLEDELGNGSGTRVILTFPLVVSSF